MKLSNILSRRNRILLRELVVTDFKLRYQGSAIGYAWSILKPLILFAVLYVVFDKFLGFGRGIEHFPIYLLVGVVFWSFFVETTTQGLRSIISRGGLIRKINFPKYIIVISGTISSLINLGFSLIVVFIFLFINGVELQWSALLIIPLIVELYVFALGLAFFLAALNVKYRDIGYLWEVVLQAAFYGVPIIYPIQMIMTAVPVMTKIIMINPVAMIIQDMRYSLVTTDTITSWQILDGWLIIVPSVIIVFFCLLGMYYFKVSQKYFAELI